MLNTQRKIVRIPRIYHRKEKERSLTGFLRREIALERIGEGMAEYRRNSAEGRPTLKALRRISGPDRIRTSDHLVSQTHLSYSPFALYEPDAPPS